MKRLSLLIIALIIATIFARSWADTVVRVDTCDSVVGHLVDSLVQRCKEPAATQLGEVIVTAREHTGIATSSLIGRDAMEHLQPTSFTDLLELLPGNISHNPDMGSVNLITLRETGTLTAQGARYQSADYAITSLGTLFMVDGAPMNTDAVLQSEGLTVSESLSPAYGRITTNRGVDMRSIATDNIESVEIIRGIPSAEYGNLSSGMVNIRRIRRSTPFTFRLKVDEYSKLISAAKGIGFHGDRHILNFDFGFMDSKSDPRSVNDSYKRISGSARVNMRFGEGDVTAVWNAGIDYTGSFDRTRIDPDLNYRRIDEYRNTYGRIALTSDFTLRMLADKIISTINVSTNASLQVDRLHRRKEVSLSRTVVAPTSMAAGESIGTFLPGNYMAEYLNDGRPVSFFLKAMAKGVRTLGAIYHTYKGGGEWTIAKNFGRGQVYDLSRPLTTGWTSRPREYREIPALHVLSFFLEDNMQWHPGEHQAELQVGVRSIQLPHLDNRYYLAGKIYLDPRINAMWTFAPLKAGSHEITFNLGTGYGLTTRMPTVDYLYPQVTYNDFLQLNYYDSQNPDRSLVSLMTYIDDATNYNLRPARNRKFEVSGGFNWGPISVSVTAFHEKMTDGFRYSSDYSPYVYKKYDINSVPATGMPQLENLTYEQRTVLGSKRFVTNGTRIVKRGVEFTVGTARWNPLRTAVTISGAWLRTTYSNSQKLYQSITDVVGSQAVSDYYVGLYNTRDGRVNEQVNTNFMFDTQIRRPELIVTTTFQFMWFVKTRTLTENGTPEAYLATDGQLHPYDEAARNDPVLQHLEKHYNPELFRAQRTPLAAYMNLKVTKPLGKHVRIALFVNRIIDYLPDYKSNGFTIRRSADAYFGMELNLKF